MENLFRGYKKALIYAVAGLAMVTAMACAGTVSVQPTTPAPVPTVEPTSPLPPAAAPSTMTEVMVTLQNGKVMMDMATMPAGPTRFLVKNDGSITHAFAVMGQGIDQRTSDLAPGETAMLDVTLTPGEYEGYCPMNGHRQKGMTMMFTVQ